NEMSKQCDQMPGNDGAQCNPMDPCSQNGVCSGGACMKGQPIDCSFLNDQCGMGACDPVKGCVKMTLADGTPCDDGLFCTIADACSAGVCKGAPNQCAPPGTPCQIGVCNEALKTCQPGIAPDGTACMSGNTCVTGETCLTGKCQGGQPTNNGNACSDGNGCDV